VNNFSPLQERKNRVLTRWQVLTIIL